MSDGSHIRLTGAFAGIGSGLTKVAVGHGFDTIKIRLQCAPPGTYTGAVDCLRKLIRHESAFALYKGALPPALGWSAIDSVLLGSLHNYRLLLAQYGMTEHYSARSHDGRLTEGERLTLLGHGLAGLGAGLTSAAVATPVELLKVKLQLQSQRAVADRVYKGPWDCAKQIVRKQGPLGLWTGFTGSLAFRAQFFWMFGSIEVLMRSFARLKGTPYELGPEMSTFFAGGLGSFVFWAFGISPDNVKNRMMSISVEGRGPRRSFAEVAQSTHRAYGLRGFFFGLSPTLLRAFPTNAAAYFVYESIMRSLAAEETRH